MNKIKKELCLSLLFIFLMVSYAVLPANDGQPGLLYKQYFPMPLDFILTLFNRWVTAPLAAFVFTLLVLQLLRRLSGPMKKRRGLKIAFWVLSGVSLAALAYWTLGSFFALAPLPPMSFGLWLFLFGKGPAVLCAWWSVTAVTLHCAVEL